MTALYGISGHAYSGKDTIADWLAMYKGFYKTYTSKPLERALLTINPHIPNEHAYDGSKFVFAMSERYSELHARVGYSESKKNPEVRNLLQTIGDAFREAYGPHTVFELAMAGAGHRNTVITGIRYPFEIGLIHKARGKMIWVDRGGSPVNDHPVENSIGPNDCDIIVSNLGTLEELYESLSDRFRFW